MEEYLYLVGEQTISSSIEARIFMKNNKSIKVFESYEDAEEFMDNLYDAN